MSSQGDSSSAATTVKFKSVKKRKQKNFRSARRDSDSDGDGSKRAKDDSGGEQEDGEFNLDKMRETMELQKLRQR